MEDVKVRVPQQQRSIEKKENIIEAGMKLFSSKGYHNISTTDIAKEAGVSVGTFYAYFKDKKALFLEYMRVFWGQMITDLFEFIDQTIRRVQDRRKLIRLILEKLEQIEHTTCKYDEQVIIMKHIDPDVKALKEKHEREIVARILKLLTLFKKESSIKDIEAASHIIQICIEETMHYIFFTNHNINQKNMINELEDMIFRYIFAK